MSLDSFIQDFSGKNILILGLGNLGGGAGVIEVFQQFKCQIRITDLKQETQLAKTLQSLDKKNIETTTFGSHNTQDVDWADLIIKNPAVPNSTQIVAYAQSQRKHITSEAALFLKYTQSTSIGITGTRGKTTTTQATFHILSQVFGEQVFIGGNMQNSTALKILLAERDQKSFSVLELSSFALESFPKEQVSPHIAAITNIYADHLNRYNSLEEYAKTKANIFTQQSENDLLFLRHDDDWTSFLLALNPKQAKLVEILPALKDNPPKLRGDHNLWNLSFAVTIAQASGVDQKTAIKLAQTFAGVEFRQQLVGQSATTKFINDATSTTPEALSVALKAYPQATFIVGGTTKHLPLDKISVELQNFKGKLIFLNGSGSKELVSILGRSNEILHLYLASAFGAAIKTDAKTVVFSPGFTSFEMFENEFDRAQQFNNLVNDLLSHHETK